MCAKYYQLRHHVLKNCISLKLARFLEKLIYRSIKIRVICSVWFERRKVDKKQTYMKTETCKLYSKSLLDISAKYHQNQSL